MVGGGWLGGRERDEKHVLLLLGAFSTTVHDDPYRHTVITGYSA